MEIKNGIIIDGVAIESINYTDVLIKKLKGE